MTSTRKNFTLFEIVVSMALLSVISSFFVFKGWGMIQEQRFLSSCRRVQNQLHTANLTSLALGCDLCLKFSAKEGKTELFIECFDPPRLLQSKVNQTIPLPNLLLDKEIVFYANGYISDRAQLICVPARGRSKPRYISPEI